MNKQLETNYVSSLGYHYWENLVRIHDIYDMMIGNIEKSTITKESIFFYTGIALDAKDVFVSGWSVHKDIDSFIGYMLHVYMPTVYFNWMDTKSEGFFIPIATFPVVKTEVLASIEEVQREEKDSLYGQALESFRDRLVRLKGRKREEVLEEVYKICQECNELLGIDNSNMIYMRVFGESREIVDFILGDGEDCFEEVIEEEIHMPIQEFRDVCAKVYDEPFINKTFIDILNQEMPIWF